MAITIVEQKKSQKQLIIVLGIALAGIIFVLLAKFVKIEEVPIPSFPPHPPPKLPKMEINFSVLENPVFKELTEPFPALPSLSFEGADQYFGRENPFQEIGWGEIEEIRSSGEETEINE